jgi:hypothetical protein
LYFKATPFSDVLMFFLSFAIAAFCCRASRCRNINMQSINYFENRGDNEKSNVKGRAHSEDLGVDGRIM